MEKDQAVLILHRTGKSDELRAAIISATYSGGDLGFCPLV